MELEETLGLGDGEVRRHRTVLVEVWGPNGTHQQFGPLTCPVDIGSARSNQVVLDDEAVSRFHLVVEEQLDSTRIKDLGSRNGTWLQGHRIHEMALDQRVELTVGKSRVILDPAGRPQIEELPADPHFGDLIGHSVAMRRLFGMLLRAARAGTHVLLEGETGTGKELAARALHQMGPNPSGPFVVVDCGAASSTLVDAELFGHEVGAFTGADRERVGALEAADGGTLFLDEIGELPLSLQPKLLRALETGEVKRLGATRHEKVDFRVVSATHRSLRREINEGRFREDLYFRLAVLPLHIPPLRDRMEDLRPLVRTFLARALGLDPGAAQVPEPRADAIAFLERGTWPGNVRELRNTIERAAAFSEVDALSAGDLLPGLRAQHEALRADEVEGMEDAKRRFEHEYLIALLERHQWAVADAAAEARLHPKSLQRLMRRHGIKKP